MISQEFRNPFQLILATVGYDTGLGIPSVKYVFFFIELGHCSSIYAWDNRPDILSPFSYADAVTSIFFTQRN